MNWRPLIFALTVALLLMAGCGPSNQATIQTNGMRFVKDTLYVKAGEPVILELVNRDAYAHAFDLDAFGIHLPLPAKNTIEISFTPAPGTYQFYCGAPGHQDAGMTGTLIVEP